MKHPHRRGVVTILSPHKHGVGVWAGDAASEKAACCGFTAVQCFLAAARAHHTHNRVLLFDGMGFVFS